MFQEAINYPRESDSAVKNVAIGGILLVLSFLFVPTLFVLGYIVRALRSVLDGIERPPEFDDWGELGMDGLKAFAIGLVYSLVPALLIAVTLVASGVTLGFSGAGQGGNAVAALVAVGISLLATVVIGLLTAVAVGAILAPFITFYANVAGAHAIGTAVREMPAVEDGADASMSQPAT